MDKEQNNQHLEGNIKSKITLDESIVTELLKTSKDVPITHLSISF